MSNNMTYKQAHNIIMSHIENLGWVIKRRHTNGRPLKVQYATNPSMRTRLYFKAQSIYTTNGGNLEFKYARAWTYHLPAIKEWAQAIEHKRKHMRGLLEGVAE